MDAKPLIAQSFFCFRLPQAMYLLIIEAALISMGKVEIFYDFDFIEIRVQNS